MRDVLDELLRRWTAGEPAALATVTATWSSAPRPPGAAMLVAADGTVAGSVSGGCVEAAVYEAAAEVLASGEPRTLRYGVSDADAYDVGLPCGGTVEVFVRRVDRTTMPDLPALAAAVAAGRPATLVTCVAGPPDRVGRHRVITDVDGPSDGDQLNGTDGAAGNGQLTDTERTADNNQPTDTKRTADNNQPTDTKRTADNNQPTDTERTADGDEVALREMDGGAELVQTFSPPARMIVCGATDHAAALARVGSFLGFRVTVCDPRSVFATAARLPAAHDVVVDWPHRYLAAEADAGRLGARDAVCVLTHDARFDVPALRVALGLGLAYVGAMGSRRTHEDRLARLRAAGVDDAVLARLASPIGLDLGARTPEEVAVSVAAEIVARRRGGSTAPLSTTEGPVHRLRP